MISSFTNLFTISVAHAQLALPGVVEPVATGGTVLTFICSVVFKWIFTGLILFSVGLALYAAYNYMTSAGDPGKLKTANNTLIYVAVGIVIAILARTVPVAVGSFVSGDLNLDPCTATRTGTSTTPTGN